MDTLKEDNFTGLNQDELYSNMPLKYLTASSIIGDKVRNGKDESMGEINDIMIDITTGKIDYVIIELGGFLGMGTKYFAIPFGMLQVDADKKMFVFNQEKEMLENAPGFDLDHWPDTNFHKEETYWHFV